MMVCLGNICRSPIAEGVLRHKVKDLELDWVIDSAGTESYHIGQPPHKFSQNICLTNSIDISEQKARQFTLEDFSRYDKIYAMAEDVYDEIEHIGGRRAQMEKVDYFLNELYAAGAEQQAIKGFKLIKNASVPDPWYGEEDGYANVYALIAQTCDAIIKKYK